MNLIKAVNADFAAVCSLYQSVCGAMQSAGIDQWRWGEYPNEAFLRESLEAGTLYVAREADRLLCAVTIDQHLPGHRDFYRADAQNCKFYQRAVARGLHIAEVPFGMAKLHMIDINELHEIGMALFREDPDVLLCDDPECLFCSKYRH